MVLGLRPFECRVLIVIHMTLFVRLLWGSPILGEPHDGTFGSPLAYLTMVTQVGPLTILVVNLKFGLSWAIHSASEVKDCDSSPST